MSQVERMIKLLDTYISHDVGEDSKTEIDADLPVVPQSSASETPFDLLQKFKVGQVDHQTIRLKNLPIGKPDLSKDFELITLNNGRETMSEWLSPEEILIQVIYISVDPYIRGLMKTFFDSKTKDILSDQIGVVVKMGPESKKNANISINDLVVCNSAWATYNIIKESDIKFNITKHVKDPKYTDYAPKIPLSYYLGAYGVPGQTAMYGLYEIGKLKKRENVFISAAAGGIGSIAAQIAKMEGCHVVGTVSNNEEKKKWLLDELKLGGVIDYSQFDTFNNSSEEMEKELAKEFPNGIDLYFDNVGGFVTASVWSSLNPNSRVVVCGQSAVYNEGGNTWDQKDDSKGLKPPKIDDFLYKLLYLNARMEGVDVKNYEDKTVFYRDMGKWIVQGKIDVKETVVKGFENTAHAFVALFESENIGKMLVQL